MRQSKHPLVERDLVGIVEHIIDVTQGDFDAAARRLDEIDALIRDIAANPTSGMRLSGPLDGWLVQHGGRRVGPDRALFDQLGSGSAVDVVHHQRITRALDVARSGTAHIAQTDESDFQHAVLV